MAGTVEQKLSDLGVTLPEPPAPAAAYVPFVRSGALVYVSGQVAIGPDGPVIGTLGADLSVAEGQAAARICAINLLAQVKAACDGDLDRVAQVVKLTGFVNAAPDFTDHPEVINGASELIGAVFGAAGRHARAAVGCVSLPRGVAVEVEGVFELR